MRSSKEVLLNLEVLEDRIALNGAFRGAIDAGAPSVPPVNGLSVNTSITHAHPGFRDDFFAFDSQPTGDQLILQDQLQSMQSQLQTFEHQLQAFQAAQIKALDQFFSELGAMLKPLHLNPVLIL